MKKILLSLATIGTVAALAFGLSSAFFSDTETSTGNLLQAGELDLKIDNESYYNGVLNTGTTWGLADLPGHLFFDFHDLKPDDYGEDTISLHVQNDAWACMSISKTEDDDETCTEPELLDDSTCAEPDTDLADGELGSNLHFIFWADDGDNVLEENETVWKTGLATNLFDGAVWTLADSLTNIWTGVQGPILGGQTKNIGKAWCFGTSLTPQPLASSPYPSGPAGDNNQNLTPGEPEDGGFTCDGTTLNNATQTDLFKADVEFSSTQTRNNPGFLCQQEIVCQDVWAAGVVSSSQGTRKDGSAVLAERTDPNDTLGPAQSAGLVDDTPVVFGSFFSLGFKIPTPGTGGSIVLSYTNPFFDQAGNDIQVYEVTGGTYPDERLKIEASQDGSSWTLIAASVSRDATVDMAPMPWAKYLRLTDVSDISLFEPTADAYDLDGVKVFCGTPD